MIFPTNYQPPKILRPGKKPFNFPSASIRPQFPTILGFWFFASSAMRRYHFNIAIIAQSLIEAVTVICLVANYFIRRILSKATVNRRFNQFHFMGRSAFNVNGDRNTRSVRDCHDLGAFATLCLADRKTPFFAGTKLPSIKASRMSIPPRLYRSSTNSCTMRWNIPARLHCWNRRWQVWYGGYRCGRSFQGAPVRKIHKTPFNTLRGSRPRRPLGSFTAAKDAIIGSIRFHRSFVSSILILLHNQA